MLAVISRSCKLLSNKLFNNKWRGNSSLIHRAFIYRSSGLSLYSPSQPSFMYPSFSHIGGANTALGFCSLTLLCLLTLPVQADEQPLWEAGIGVAALHHPHYLGAEQSRGYILPVPYFNYRGSYIRADRHGIRGFLYDSDKWDLRLSFSGSLPVNSEDNDARAGMDNLDLMLEVGPTLQYSIYSDAEQLWRFDLPVRAAFLLGDQPFYHQGWTINPRLHYQHELGPWSVVSTLGPVFSDNRYHAYIYEVGLQDVAANRAFYQAEDGYTGSRFSIKFRRRIDEFYVSLAASYYSLHDAENEESPLLLQDEYVAVSVVFSWVFGSSATMVAD